MSWIKQLFRSAKGTPFSIWMFDPNEVVGKKLVDVVIQDMGGYYEFQLIFEDGKQIEIVLTDDNMIDIQTD